MKEQRRAGRGVFHSGSVSRASRADRHDILVKVKELRLLAVPGKCWRAPEDKMDQAQLAAALQAEYLHLQKTIEDFDARLITIKAWSVTFSMTALVGAFASGAPAALLVASVAALLFWILEVQWKFFQLGYYSRSAAIEQHFRGDVSLPFPFQIGDTWYRTWVNHVSIGTPGTPPSSRSDKVKSILRVALWPHVMLPHAFVAAAGIVVFVLVQFDVISMGLQPQR